MIRGFWWWWVVVDDDQWVPGDGWWWWWLVVVVDNRSGGTSIQIGICSRDSPDHIPHDEEKSIFSCRAEVPAIDSNLQKISKTQYECQYVIGRTGM